MSKLVIFGQEVREKLITGINIVADAVGLTLGAKGRNVAIERHNNYPLIVHDGVTVAKSIDLKDPFENMGANLIKEAAINTNDLAGDGTTTTTILTQALVNKGFQAIENGANPMTLIKGLDQAYRIVLGYLQATSTQIKTQEELEQVATISSGFSELGKLIANAFEKVGKNGLITIEESNNETTTVVVKDGFDFNKGLTSTSPFFMTSPTNAELTNPTIFVTDLPIYASDDMLKIVEMMLQNPVKEKNGNLVIIADKIVDRALELLVVNKLKGNFNVIAVEAPAFGDHRKDILQDIAILTGATVLSKDTGMTLSSVQPEFFGCASKVVAEKESTLIVGGNGAKDSIEARVAQIQESIANEKSDYNREKLEERLAKLTTGVAVIYVGGSTEVEMRERKERVIDAVSATKAALQEGIVPGGAMALLNARAVIEDFKAEDKDEILGAQILFDALTYPYKKLLENAGADFYKVGEKIANSKLKNPGYNVVSGKVVDLLKEGIIDPVMVTRLALQNSVSVASMVLTNGCLVAEEREEKK